MIGSYNDKHPRGNKIRPEELRARRDRLFAFVEVGKPITLQPANLLRLFERRMEIQTANERISNPTVADIIVRINKLDHKDQNSFLILLDLAWENAYVQTCKTSTLSFLVEYRDGATQLHYRIKKEVSVETVKLMLLTYLKIGAELMRLAMDWEDVTANP
jgi:hypothetical protein